MPKTTNLWLYFLRRDKKGVRLLARLAGQPQLAVRIEDISLLHLPPVWQDQLSQIIYDNRMLWEPWIESATDFEVLTSAWKDRGYTGIPISGQPEFTMSTFETPKATVAYLPNKSTMLRKKS